MEILHQTQIMEIDPDYKRLIAKLFIACIIGVVAFAICAFFDGGISSAITGGFAILCLLGICITAIFAPKVETGKYEYIVTIDDSISFVEIYENYEVVGRQGDVWTIRDREAIE